MFNLYKCVNAVKKKEKEKKKDSGLLLAQVPRCVKNVEESTNYMT